jgi:chemotaxis protein methyltransferase CheR
VIKVFSKNSYRHIVLQGRLDSNSIDEFSSLFVDEFNKFEVTIIGIKTLPKSFVKRLYNIIYIQKINLAINVYFDRLSRYLNSVGIANHLVDSYSSRLEINSEKNRNLEAVAIGGSSGSLENIVTIVKSIPLVDISIFIVQHIKDDSPLILNQILQSRTNYSVVYPEDGDIIKKRTIYIAKPSYHLFVEGNRVRLDRSEKLNYARPSVSRLFESVAKYYGNSSIALISSGYGSDGSDVLKYMRELGSTILIQNPNECEAKDMPNSAIATGEYNFIFSINELRTFFNVMLQTTVDKDSSIRVLLKEIYSIYGYDFTMYDRNSVKRRVDATILKLGIDSFQLFIKEVLTNRAVFDELFLNLSINVTEFFRTPSLYSAFQRVLMTQNYSKSRLKVWVAGCSTGEEAYSIAILLNELDIYKNSLIYATDFNSVVVDEAKNGIYSKDRVETYTDNFEKLGIDYKKYFYKSMAYYEVREFLLKNVLFFSHNLVSDGSFNQFDIISCKNVLIYFNQSLQERVFELFYESLELGGFLLLGDSEFLLDSFSSRFESCGNKIYRKIA